MADKKEATKVTNTQDEEKKVGLVWVVISCWTSCGGPGPGSDSDESLSSAGACGPPRGGLC